MDTGNTVPGSAAISADLARELGVKIIPSQLKVTIAAQGSPLEVVGTVASLVMGISPKNLLRLTDVVVYQNLGHQLNLGLNFSLKPESTMKVTSPVSRSKERSIHW